MPYKRKGKCVYKKSGKKVGCSESTAMAKRHMRKLYSLEPSRGTGRAAKMKG